MKRIIFKYGLRNPENGKINKWYTKECIAPSEKDFKKDFIHSCICDYVILSIKETRKEKEKKIAPNVLKVRKGKNKHANMEFSCGMCGTSVYKHYNYCPVCGYLIDRENAEQSFYQQYTERHHDNNLPKERLQ